MGFREYLCIIWARKWVMVLAATIVTATALAASFLQEPVYRAEAKVRLFERDALAGLVEGMETDSQGGNPRAVDTQVQIMRTRALADKTVQALGLDVSPESVLSRLEVVVLGQTDVVAVRFTDRDPDTAAAVANQMVEEYLAWSRESRSEATAVAIAQVEARLDEAESETSEFARRVSKEATTGEANADLQLLADLYTRELYLALIQKPKLADKLEALLVQQQGETSGGQLISPAVASDTPVSPKPVRNGAVGLAVGLAFGLGIAFVYDNLDDTIRSAEEAGDIYGAPVLGTIPAGQSLAVEQHSGSPTSEAFRALRHTVDFTVSERGIKVLAVVSAVAGEGKSDVAASLAILFARIGHRVAFLDCDSQEALTDARPVAQAMVDLGDVLHDTCSLESALEGSDANGLFVMTTTKASPELHDLFGTQKMKNLLAELRERTGLIIVNAPPLLAAADAAALARWADGVIVVTRAGSSTRNQASKSTDILEKVGARIAGLAVWGSS